MLITGGFLVLAVVALIVQMPRRQIAVQLLGRTNGVHTVLATNSSRYVYCVCAVPVVNNFSTNVMEQLLPHQSITLQVVVPTNASREIMLLYLRTESSSWENRFDAVLPWVGIKSRPVKAMYVKVPE
jgi:hypothetical protein